MIVRRVEGGRTYRHDAANSRFSQLCERAQKVPSSTVSFYSTHDIPALYGGKDRWPRTPSHFLCLRIPFMSLDCGSACLKACMFLYKTTWMHIKRRGLRERGHFEDLGVWEEDINPLTPKDLYSGRTAQLTFKRCILYIYSKNTGTEYFKHGIYCPFFSLFKLQFVS